MSIKSWISLLILCAPLGGLSQNFKEKYRPQFHFTPEKNWINDPNGLVYYAGEYHMFYQYNPFGNKWGHMSWGHAVSKDLIHWKELPVAIPEDKNVGVFSGSAIMDPFNTSGFVQLRGQVPMVAVYTADIPHTNQSQHLAYSLDSGRTFTRYNGNPVLDLGMKDFRDPKVFWHEPTRRWVMAVMLPHEKKVQFYGSRSLKAWSLLSEFGPVGDTSGIWECPDLFRVPVKGSPGRYKWVFMMSPAPYMQYFVGEFDGTRFINENPDTIFRPDYGPDYYAGIVYNNLPPMHTPVSIAWVNNWNYADQIPAGEWRGAMSLPRYIEAKKVGNSWVLVQNPVEGLKELMREETTLEARNEMPLTDQDFQLEWNWKTDHDGVQEFRINNGEFVIRYLASTGEVSLDRSGSGGFPNEAYQKLSLYQTIFPGKPGNELKFRFYFDNSIAELFVGEGEVAMTAQVFLQNGISNIGFSGSNARAIYRDLGSYRDQ